MGYSPWGHKESDTTKQLRTHTHMFDDYRNYKEKGRRWKEEREGCVCVCVLSFMHVQARSAKNVILE